MVLLLCAKRRPDKEPSEHLASQLYQWKNLQCLVCLLNIITSAFLAGYISSRDLNQDRLPASVVVTGSALIFTGLSSWIGHHLGGFFSRPWMGIFVTFDLTSLCTQIGAIILLGVSKLPWNCSRLVTVPSGYRKPESGYDTVGFGDNDTKGELDEYCGIPRMNWVLSLLLLISYVFTLGLSIRLIVALYRRAKHAKADIEGAKVAASPVSQYVTIMPVMDPNPPLAPMSMPAPIPMPVPLPVAQPQPQPQQPPGQSVFDDSHMISNEAALISDGSWSSPGLTPAASPPTYEEDKEGRAKASAGQK